MSAAVQTSTPAPAMPAAPPERRVKTPTVLQMEAVECGAAALAIVLSHFGRYVPLEELRQECGVSRDGSKANNVLRAARKYGLVAKGFKYDLPRLYALSYPCILFWNLNHFLVLEGFRQGKVYLNDPAQGPRVVTAEELDGSYSGVALTFEPGPEFKPGGEPPGLAQGLRRRLAGSEPALLFVVLCGLLLVIPGLVVPTFSRIFIDEFLIAGRASLVKPLLLGMALTALARGALTWLQQRFLARLETRLALQTAIRFFNHILRLPVNYFAQRFAGEIGSRVMINDKVAQLLSGRLATTLLDSLMIVFYAVLMMLYSVPLTLLVIALALLNVGAVRLAGRRRIDASRRLMQDKGKLLGTAMNGLRMIETLKATGSEPEFFSRWAGYQAKALRVEQSLSLISEVVNAAPPLVNMLTTTAVLLFGGLKVMGGEMTVGMLVAYQTLVASFTRPLGSLVGFGASLQELEADMSRLDDVLRYPQDPLYEQEKQPAGDGDGRLKLAGHVELRDVTFGYSPLEKPLIEKLNLAVKPGQRVALVGASGSGKSTVSRLVAGLYEPWEGEILFDGIPRRLLPRRLLTNSLAMVDQEVFLFGGTIEENVTMWDATTPPPNVVSACRDAAIDEVVETRDGAYKALVDEGGANFSGGQRQRLEIARALVGSPTLLILDEATSALDPSTEAVIDDSLRRRGCTCIIIAHRLSTIRDCDEIVVMERGRIVQRGTHDEMKDREGPYARLIQA